MGTGGGVTGGGSSNKHETSKKRKREKGGGGGRRGGAGFSKEHLFKFKGSAISGIEAHLGLRVGCAAQERTAGSALVVAGVWHTKAAISIS
jgi:hypothetical protein